MTSLDFLALDYSHHYPRRSTMRITKTTLRRIIKEELDAVMNEDRAEHVSGIEAKIKRL